MSASETGCVCCGGVRWRPYVVAQGYELVRCAECGFVRLVLPPGMDVDELYDEDYFWGRGFDESALIPEARAPNPAFTIRRRYLLDVLARETGGPGRLLDVGCGAGAVLDLARDEGWDARGQDIAEAGVAEARGRGHDVCLGPLVSCGYEAASFDAALMLEVIEHLVDPRETLAEVRRLLRPGRRSSKGHWGPGTVVRPRGVGGTGGRDGTVYAKLRPQSSSSRRLSKIPVPGPGSTAIVRRSPARTTAAETFRPSGVSSTSLVS